MDGFYVILGGNLLEEEVASAEPSYTSPVRFLQTTIEAQELALVNDSPLALLAVGNPVSSMVAFEEFAESWMEKVRHTAEQQRRKPTVRRGAVDPAVTYRGYAGGYELELRPTGNASAPYVGVIRYHEQIHSCPDGKDCVITAVVPIAEIFRFQRGRWVY